MPVISIGITLICFLFVTPLPPVGAQESAGTAQCQLDISGGNNTAAALVCAGARVTASADERLLNQTMSNSIFVSWDARCGIPGCLVTVCANATAVVFANSSISMVRINTPRFHSVLCVAGTKKVSISESILVGNSARAVLVRSGSLTIGNSIISNNTVRTGDGAALMVEGSAQVSISNSLIRFNQASGGSGGAVHAEGTANVSIFNTTISGNACKLRGGGLSLGQSASVTLRQCYVGYNSATIDGWQAAAAGGSVLHVLDDTEFVFNSTTERGVVALNDSRLILPRLELGKVGQQGRITKCSRNVAIRTAACQVGMQQFSLLTNVCSCCPQGMFSFLADAENCTRCPANARCPGGDVVVPLVGYWRSSEVSDQVHACPMSGDSCGGDHCKEGHTGPLCAACLEGYGIVSPLRCGKCMQQPQLQLVLYVFICCITVSLVAWTVHCTWKDNIEGSAGLRPSDFIKVLVQFLQYLVIVGSVSWPRPDFLRQLFNLSSVVFGAASGQVLSLDCWLGWLSGHGSSRPRISLPLAIQRQLVYFAAPFAVFAAVLGLQLLTSVIDGWFQSQSCCMQGRRRRPRTAPAAAPLVVRMLPVTALVVAFFAYPSLLRASFAMFACLPVDVPRDPSLDPSIPANATFLDHRQGYWISDIQQQCFDGWHLAWVLGLGVPAVLILCVGVPLGLFLLLRINRANAGQESFRLHFGFLYRNYLPELMWWEAVWAVQTILMSLVAAFHFTLQAYYSVLLLMLVFLMSAALQAMYRPYASEKLHLMHITSTSCLLLTAQGALVMFPVDAVAASISPMHTAVAVLLLLMDVGFILLCMYTIAASARGRVKAMLAACAGKLSTCRGSIATRKW